jgi:hypothetical protein
MIALVYVPLFFLRGQSSAIMKNLQRLSQCRLWRVNYLAAAMIAPLIC